MTTATARRMTAAEFLALPHDDGIDRWLCRGELREDGMTTRNRFHSRTMTRVARWLDLWLDTQPPPRATILTGDAGFRLPAVDADDEETVVGIDVAYVTAAVMARQTDESTIIEGVPVLAVEIISPSDTNEAQDEKIDLYLAAGVKVVWYLDPRWLTVHAYRAGANVEMFGPTHDVTAPELPGFCVPAAGLFGG